MNETRLSGTALVGDAERTLSAKYVSFCIAILVLTAAFWSFLRDSKSRLRLPGPRGIPLFGNLFDVGVTWSY